MTRMSKSITLVLIGSSLILAGCIRKRNLDTTGTELETRPAARGSSGGGSRGYYYSGYHGWWSNWGSGGAYGRAGPSGSRPGQSGAIRSGGFGSSGHAVGS